MDFRKADLKAEELRKAENDFLDSWASSVPGFIRDGIADPEKYCSASVKLLFLLKEVNGGENWDLREFLKKDFGRNETWNVVARWVQGIFNLEKDFMWKELSENNYERRKETLPYICAVNLKKASGKSVADNSVVRKTAKENRTAIKEQIALYKPDIIICCGTDYAYTRAMGIKPDWKMTSRGIYYYIEHSGTVVIAFSHPEARIKECMLHYTLIDTVREIIRNN